MLPIKETLCLTCQKAAARLASLPATHPLSKFVKRASRGLLQRHNAPLHCIFHSIDSKVDDLKAITPASRNPNATNPFTISIEESKMLAKEADNNSNGNSEQVVVYTDGSGMEGMIGAGAVLYRDGVRIRSARFLLGEDMEHTVHEGELVGIALGVQLAKMERIVIPHIKISLDNQAAIQGMENVSAKAGQHIIRKIHRAIDKLRNDQKHRRELVEASDNETRINRSTQITLTWVPGHEGIEGNKAADEEAKKAITDGSSTAATLPPWMKDTLLQNISALRQELKLAARKSAHNKWKSSARYDRTRPIDETMPSNKYLQITDELMRAEAVALIQLRTGHIGLNKHLNHINRADAPWCPHCGEGNAENITHLLHICPAYNAARAKWEGALREKTREPVEILGTKEGIKETLKFIRRTGRLKMGREDTNGRERE
ncbi:hypothetical protein PIIN_10836 [Serendipita indica DSM 11827]|uniref:RNase H type-1 domain-containing protein n=1 Tax=Serendipita indica (strain DSM 11827) TaxID=1109443 RepID=G4TZV8_SERID|nr:hypothetical protein PIIN_10836 [Serendipita indica DSM 11827]